MMDLIEKGGYLMYPLLACSVLAVAIIIEKLINLRKKRVIRPESARLIEDLIEEGETKKALAICRRSNRPFARIVGTALEHKDLAVEDIKGLVSDAGRREVPGLQRYIGPMGTIAGISPLLGLLGTVVGMIKVFNAISIVGVGQAQALSEGIAEALITTAVGLTIAIPALIFHNYFRDKADVLISEMETRSMIIIRKLKSD